MQHCLKLISASLVIFWICFSPLHAEQKPSLENFKCPTCHGLIEISTNVFTNAPEEKAHLLKIVESSRSITKEFFGKNLSNPKIVMCTNNACVRIFRKRIGKGHTVGSSYILLSPTGISKTILSHELVHTEISKRMAFASPLTMTSETIPTWFNEGLATYLSGDERYLAQAPTKDLLYAFGLKNQTTWMKSVTLKKYRRGYSGARNLVAILDEKMGREKLGKIVDLVAYGGLPFDSIVSPYLSLE